MRRNFFAAGMFVLLAASVAVADNACVSGSLASVENTSCRVGSVTFTFGNISASNNLFDYFTGTGTSSTIGLSTISITPYMNGNQVGFTIAGLPGVSVTTLNQEEETGVQLLVSSSVKTGLGGFLTDPSASSSGDVTEGGRAIVQGDEFDSSGNGSDFYTEWRSSNGAAATTTAYSYSGTGAPGSDSIQIDNQAYVFNQNSYGYIDSGNGTGSASFDAATFYVTVQPTPEPSGLLLLSAGLLGLSGVSRRKRTDS